MIDDYELCVQADTFKTFLKELKRLYELKYKEDFLDFFINSLPFLDQAEAGFWTDEESKTFKKKFCDLARFFIPLENLTRTIVNNLKTKQKRESTDENEDFGEPFQSGDHLINGSLRLVSGVYKIPNTDQKHL